MSGICDKVIPEPYTLFIRMTRGERRIAEELRKHFGGFERVVIDVDGERHGFDADSFIRLLEGYESYGQVPKQGKGENEGECESYRERTRAAIDDWMAVKDGRKSRWHELFGTPERAARTFEETCAACKLDNCGRCGLEGLMNHVGSYDALLEWLRGEA